LGQKRNLHLALKALKFLGVRPLAYLGIYRLGLISGHYRRVTSKLAVLPDISQVEPNWPLNPPDREELCKIIENQNKAILNRADKILEGIYPLFGGPEQQINLAPIQPLADWTEYELGKASGEIDDIKFIWEGARFCWAVNLAQAYQLTGDDRYPEKFWQLFDTFFENNPPFLGPNWVSAQESAIRIITVSFAMSVFSKASGFTKTRRKRVLEFLILNARRIPPTLPYSRAQNNNHLLIEGAGLYTAGVILQGYLASEDWKSQGWEIFHHALSEQIGLDGEYCQHSLNYHRLMLQASLWVWIIARNSGDIFPGQSLGNLRSASIWYAGLIDPVSGCACNLGSNDGTWLFPLGGLEYADHRPTAQAASLVFTGRALFPSGELDELGFWIEVPRFPVGTVKIESVIESGNLRIGEDRSWASLRTARYTNRPFQADQLHLDLWYHGQNIFLDAGTYRYNAPPPWDNSLSGTSVHNTVIVDGFDQMTRSGKFLWLDWAQSKIIEMDQDHCLVSHDGYKRLGVTHQREARRITDLEWLIKDMLLPVGGASPHTFTLQWLLPDAPYKWENHQAEFDLNNESIFIEILTDSSSPQNEFQLIRAGNLIEGEGSAPNICGWFSPTYGYKVPALSFRVNISRKPPLTFTTRILIEPSNKG
jgi:hypothetical protein